MSDPQVFKSNDAPTQKFMDNLWEAVKGRAKAMAPVFGEGSGGTALSRDHIDMLWSERHLTPEQEAQLWRQGRTPESIAAGEKPLTPEEIALQVFQNRERLMKSGGRIEPNQWVSWCNATARRMQEKQDTSTRVGDALPDTGNSAITDAVPSRDLGLG